MLGRLAGKYAPGPRPVVAYTAHGFHFYRGAPWRNWLLYYPAERFLARYTDLLLVVNDEDYRRARGFPLRPGGSLWKLPGVGLDLERFSPPSPQRRQALRRAYGLGEEFFLLSLGELNENKNHQVVLRALAQLKARPQGLPPLRYAICGEGFFRPRLERAIRELGLSGVAELWGLPPGRAGAVGLRRRHRLPPPAGRAWAWRGVESLAMGVPVLAADNRGTREYMEQGGNGFLCRWDDPGDFARGLEALWALGPGQRQAMSRRCVDAARPFAGKYAQAVMRRVQSSAA